MQEVERLVYALQSWITTVVALNDLPPLIALLNLTQMVDLLSTGLYNLQVATHSLPNVASDTLTDQHSTSTAAKMHGMW